MSTAKTLASVLSASPMADPPMPQPRSSTSGLGETPRSARRRPASVRASLAYLQRHWQARGAKKASRPRRPQAPRRSSAWRSLTVRRFARLPRVAASKASNSASSRQPAKANAKAASEAWRPGAASGSASASRASSARAATYSATSSSLRSPRTA